MLISTAAEIRDTPVVLAPNEDNTFPVAPLLPSRQTLSSSSGDRTKSHWCHLLHGYCTTFLNYGGEVAAAVEPWWTARDGSRKAWRQQEVKAVMVRRLLVMQLKLELEMVRVLLMVWVDVVVMVDCWTS
ncbi:hypothetical protein Dsin_008604 [Dipteronia sinensis]|uniref:Uncharacterized protein n=1 Tax=Dipteronia sinensis TaxID=43782 RepID=A0AAE0AQ50_9ROSI|nr:hypothetical protein Dsin_008604 [Dipteronia sinensis]